MKKIILLVLAVCVGMISMAQKAVVKGEMRGFGEGAKLIVQQPKGNQLEVIDSVAIDEDGEYKITLNPEGATLYVLTFNRKKSPVLHVMLEGGEHVTMSAEYVSAYNFAKIIEAKGSGNVEVYRRFNNAMMDPNTAVNIEAAVKEYRHSVMSAFLVTYFDQDFDNKYKVYEIVRDGLIDKYADNEFVKYIDTRLKTTILPGKEAPEIAMLGVDGKTRKLSDLRGKVVLVDFWASWCTPCRRENPHVVAIYHKYKDMGFDIYSVSLDKTREAWVEAIKKDGLVWENHVSDLMGWQSTGGKAYGIMSVPSTVLIDRDGKVIARNLRGDDLERAVKEALEKDNK